MSVGRLAILALLLPLPAMAEQAVIEGLPPGVLIFDAAPPTAASVRTSEPLPGPAPAAAAPRPHTIDPYSGRIRDAAGWTGNDAPAAGVGCFPACPGLAR